MFFPFIGRKSVSFLKCTTEGFKILIAASKSRGGDACVGKDELDGGFKPLIHYILMRRYTHMLIEKANSNGGRDNIGVVMAEPLADEVSVW